MLGKVSMSYEIKTKLERELYCRCEPPHQRLHFKPLHTTHENDEVFYLDLVFLHLFITLNPERLTSCYTSYNPFLHTIVTYTEHMSI